MIGFLRQSQVHDLLSIFRVAHTVFIGEVIGSDILSDEDLQLLRKFGIKESDIKKMMSDSETMFALGRMTAALKQAQADRLSYDDVTAIAKRGGFRPLNEYELATLDEIKNQSYWAIKNLESAVIKDVHDVIIQDGARVRSEYEKIIRDESKQVVHRKKSLQSMMLDIGHKTGDWSRKLSRVVETEMHNAFDRGRAATIVQQYGDDAIVYKDVKEGACRYCVKLYLSAGFGSEPKNFKISELTANGTNIGRKAADYKPVIGTTHPYCRCELRHVPVGYDWNDEERDYSTPSKSGSWRKTQAHKMAPIVISTDRGSIKV